METIKSRLFIRSQNRLEFDVYIMRCEGIAGFIDMLSPEDVFTFKYSRFLTPQHSIDNEVSALIRLAF